MIAENYCYEVCKVENGKEKSLVKYNNSDDAEKMVSRLNVRKNIYYIRITKLNQNENEKK